MIREFLSNLHWSALPIASLIIFLAVFVGIVIWVYRKDSQSIYQELENLPLHED